MIKRVLTRNNLTTFVSILILLSVNASAQRVASTVGGSYQNSTIQLDFTLGQVSIDTYGSSSVIVTQGFHQTFDEIITGLKQINTPITISAYPNPTNDFLIIEIPNFEESVNYQFYNLKGQMVKNGKFISEHKLYLLGNSEGVYLLTLTNERGHLIKSLKIQISE